MTEANVRHHLSVLQADGRIITIGEARPRKRGRPVKLFGPSESYLGENLAVLADLLLTARFEAISPRARSEAIRSIAADLDTHMDPNDQELSVPMRLSRVVEKLDAMHYQAHWEAGARGPRILFAHCPYAAIIARHPELCIMDAELLSKEFGIRAHQMAKIGTGGALSCIFELGKS